METGPRTVEDGMANEWYCNMSGDVSGPLTDAQLKELADGGYLSPDDPVRQTAEGSWVAAGRVNGLFAAARSPLETEQKVRAASATEGRPAGHLPVAKAVDGPPPVPSSKPPIRHAQTSQRDEVFSVDAGGAASARSRSRKRRQHLITSPTVLAISAAGVVLGGAVFLLSRTETAPVSSDDDVPIAKAASAQPDTARETTADPMEGLDIDELNRLISKPLDSPKPAQAGTVDQLAGRTPDDSPQEPVAIEVATTTAEPDVPEAPEPRETMGKVLEDDRYSPKPIPGLTDVDGDDKKESGDEGTGRAR